MIILENKDEFYSFKTDDIHEDTRWCSFCGKRMFPIIQIRTVWKDIISSYFFCSCLCAYKWMKQNKFGIK